MASSTTLEKEFLEFSSIVDILCVQIVLLNFIMKIALDVRYVENLLSNLRVQKGCHLTSIFCMKWLRRIHSWLNATLTLTMRTKIAWLGNFAMNTAKELSIFIVQITKLFSAENALSCFTLTMSALLLTFMKSKECDNYSNKTTKRILIRLEKEITIECIF